MFWLFQNGLLQKQNLIHLVLPMLFISQSSPLSHLSLCSKSLFAALSNLAVFSASLESAFMQWDCSGQASQDNSMCEGFALRKHKDKPLASSLLHPTPPPQHHAHRHAGTHTCCVMVQFNPESTGFVSYPSNRTAGGDGESLQLPNKALSKLEERIPF